MSRAKPDKTATPDATADAKPTVAPGGEGGAAGGGVATTEGSAGGAEAPAPGVAPEDGGAGLGGPAPSLPPEGVAVPGPSATDASPSSAADYGGVDFMDRAVSAHYYDADGGFLGVLTRAGRGDDAMTPAELCDALGIDPAQVLGLNLDTGTIVTRDGQRHRLG